ncbi:hypothetical protein PIB30_067270 [Stylosanthes scabra]|uniref:F-box associated beta-propeller type 1 domain-containing protein n=1 Tax=Stylosanthes scabra TaxID=79078 RepID=A0ABU6WQU9_9FABA|nr:hypothetical protein [Stylosanthes scabra]
MIPADASLYGFGYDASRDDYLVVVAWHDSDRQHHLDCFSLRDNSWINLDSALPKPFGGRERQCCGLFLNGSIHWLSYSIKADSEALLMFDLKERTFSKIYVPEQLVTCHSPNLVLLGGCLALYSQEFGQKKTDIWVMKEYKVNSSWTYYEIPGRHLKPLCLSSNGDIIVLDSIFPYGDLKFAKYNVRGELLQHFERPSRHEYRYPIDHSNYYTESLLLFPSYRKHKDRKKKKNVIWLYGTSYTVTESLLPLPSVIKDKKKKKKNGHYNQKYANKEREFGANE